MNCLDFCTCPNLECDVYPDKRDGQCTACIKKNLDHHEIPACFWMKIGETDNAKTDYTFVRFAKAVMEAEAGK